MCISKFDLDAAHEHYKEESLGGVSALPADYKKAVIDTFEKGEVVEPPKPEHASTLKQKKTKAVKKAYTDDDEMEMEEPKVKPKRKGPGRKKEEDTEDEAEASQPTYKRKGTCKKRTSRDLDDSSEEAEYVPRKSRSRAKSMAEVIDPTVVRA